ncbi:MAG: hypothetical protein CVV06_20675 [Gammaproteobacteria bacterium HGW-Gammaproteobacteria-10]|jgi:CheY-like chemotaxis protein|nr:MAG: hypothetical protein CVV13_03710 [Gammaproteobacteria bacterium HGW-Gammaproteobacteria-3]PKM33347.1 MAG: hypothetical protein CVV06_20675 [Gammaproteobacteria bacterium HGW-Gammaproteobacteria-10]
MSSKAVILIIDDVVENIQVAMNVLKEDSYDLSFATNGTESLALIENNAFKFDLILLSIIRLKPPASSRLASADKMTHSEVCDGLQVLQLYGFSN